MLTGGMRRAFTVIATILPVLAPGCREQRLPTAAQPHPESGDPALTSFLTYYDARYDGDEGMLLVEFSTPGYHSRIAAGSPVHPTRESLIYALALLQRNGDGDNERAAGIVSAVLDLQDVDSRSAACGVWPWVREEPLAEMPAPDLNWSDFCGALLAQMLVQHSGQLSDELQERMRESVGRAAGAIRRRDVGPAYTNIAIIGGGVCAVCGELLHDDELLAYGRNRLQGVVEHTRTVGSFNEYNSPPYACVVLGECERTLQLVRDPATREAAESLRRMAWEMVAGSFHPVTQQWAGPHSRTSRDRLRPRTVQFLSRRTGVELQVHPSMIDEDMPGRYAVVNAIPCPDDLIENFRTIDHAPRQVRQTFIRGESAADTVIGTTWFAEDCCLGSVNRATFWTQRKPLLAYWRTDADPAVVFRVRFLHDGPDFASMGIVTAQEGPRTLSLIVPVRGQGDWHPRLDRPADGVFEAADLRLRCELRGAGVDAESLPGDRFVLSAGDRRAVIHPVEGQFGGHDVVWEPGREKGHVYVDAVCYRGDPRRFDFNAALDVVLGMGIEVLGHDDPVAGEAPSARVESGKGVTCRWSPGAGGELSVESSGR